MEVKSSIFHEKFLGISNFYFRPTIFFFLFILIFFFFLHINIIPVRLKRKLAMPFTVQYKVFFFYFFILYSLKDNFTAQRCVRTCRHKMANSANLDQTAP